MIDRLNKNCLFSNYKMRLFILVSLLVLLQLVVANNDETCEGSECGSTIKYQRIEGKITNMPKNEWQANTRILVNYGEYIGFIR
jgi:hypothetical protein